MNYPTTELYTTNISEDECIGDSLTTINANFSAIDTGLNRIALQPIVTFVCERNSTGSQDGFMSYGNGYSTHNGICMPYSGVIFAATLRCDSFTGTVAIDPCVNGSPKEDYRLTVTGVTNTSASDIEYFSTPLIFNAGDLVGWKQTIVPTTAKGYHVVYMVKFSIPLLLQLT